MNTIQAQITFGIGTDKHGNPLDTASTAAWESKRIIEESCCKNFGGFTWVKAQGGWKSDAGDIVIEDSMILVIVTDSDKLAYVRSLAIFIRDAYNQSSVLLTVTEVNTQLI